MIDREGTIPLCCVTKIQMNPTCLRAFLAMLCNTSSPIVQLPRLAIMHANDAIRFASSAYTRVPRLQGGVQEFSSSSWWRPWISSDYEAKKGRKKMKNFASPPPMEHTGHKGSLLLLLAPVWTSEMTSPIVK
jgi:hypothetical protein